MGTKTKSDNRRALPKYILTIVIAAFFGALAGFGAGIVGTGNLSEGVKTAVNAALTAAAPWGIPVTSVVFLGLGWRLYAKARRLYNTWDGEAEEPVDTAEETLSWALLMSAIALLWDFFFLSVLVICGAGSSLERLGGVTLFLVSVAVIVVLQQKVVDLTRRINPEKQGSVYDLKFQKSGWTAATSRKSVRSARRATRPTGRRPIPACGCGWCCWWCTTPLIRDSCPSRQCWWCSACSRSSTLWSVSGWAGRAAVPGPDLAGLCRDGPPLRGQRFPVR